MAKTAMIRARTEPELKENVATILKRLGLNESEAINMFYNMIQLNNGIPFEVKVPNEITEQTLRSTDQGKDLNSFDSPDEMFDSLEM